MILYKPDLAARFDSLMDDARPAPNGNFDLFIILKVFLKPNNGGPKIIHDNDQERFLVNDWSSVELSKFKYIYQKTGQAFWDNRFWLNTPANYVKIQPSFQYEYHNSMMCHSIRIAKRGSEKMSLHPESYNPCSIMRKRNINCRFQLELVNTGAEAHHTIDAFNITHKFDGNTAVPLRPGEPAGFRSSNLALDKIDVLENHVITQRTHIHEIGHNLGLDHSGVSRQEPLCIAAIARSGFNANTPICYGSTAESGMNVMGSGMNLSLFDADPWQKAMKSLTGQETYWEAQFERELVPNFILPRSGTN